jgi:hypothetical protein
VIRAACGVGLLVELRRATGLRAQNDPSLSFVLLGSLLLRCRGFNDGLLMLRCEACKEWFHGKCVQVRFL